MENENLKKVNESMSKLGKEQNIKVQSLEAELQAKTVQIANIRSSLVSISRENTNLKYVI